MRVSSTVPAKFNAVTGKPPVLEWLATGELSVDPSYQRSLEAETSRSLIHRMAVDWSWGLCLPLTVARRPDGTLKIVDGQHRHAAAAMRGDIPHLPCVVVAFESVIDEAAAFVEINKRRRALGAVDVFKASLAAGQGEACEVMRLIADARLSLAPHQNFISWKPGQLYCIPTIRNGLRRHGRTVVSAALCALSEAFRGQVLQFAGNMLEGLIAFYAEMLPRGDFDPDLFAERLSRNLQFDWIRKAKLEAARHNLNRKDAMRAVLMRAYDQEVCAA